MALLVEMFTPECNVSDAQKVVASSHQSSLDFNGKAKNKCEFPLCTGLSPGPLSDNASKIKDLKKNGSKVSPPRVHSDPLKFCLWTSA
ncbi:Hypothetical protein NTJ_05552 [Nesidiocoris tenuis]|uniref:Uncharacterized protein n=1 Tax=Nesidiocoris tenuis TaxID=355587 RepID=A0ABN7AKG7_9HEMI|nr:Hypothetical protein NTJ_05552 [Nesidiocoris tenuis]